MANQTRHFLIHTTPLNKSVAESEPEAERDDAELFTHKFVADKKPAPLSTSYVEEDEEGEEGEEEPEKQQPEAHIEQQV